MTILEHPTVARACAALAVAGARGEAVVLDDRDVAQAAAGHPRTVVPSRFRELVRITGGRVASVA